MSDGVYGSVEEEGGGGGEEKIKFNNYIPNADCFKTPP